MSVKEYVEEVKKDVMTIQPFEIATQEDYVKAAEVIKQARKLLKNIDQKEKEATKPINQALKNIRNWFRPMKDQLKRVISELNSGMFKYKRIQEEERLKEEAKNKEIQPEEKSDIIFKPEEIKPDIRIRKVWKFKVVDKSKIKPDFLIPDEKAIGELVRKLHEKAIDLVGGIEVYFEETAY